jgi:hypothetical protein
MARFRFGSQIKRESGEESEDSEGGLDLHLGLY